MGTRCGCAGNCSCAFKEGRGVRMSGGGSKLDPVLIEIQDGQAFIQSATTETVEVTVTGVGSVADPYVVTMTRYSGDAGAPVFIFTTPGNYVFSKPNFGTLAWVYMAGAGGGGGAGGAYAIDGSMRWGVGGSGGTVQQLDYLLDDLDDEIPIVVGAGGGGGALASSGGPGGTSSFDGGSALGGAGGASLPQQGNPNPDPRVAAAPGQGGSGGLWRILVDGSFPYPGLQGGAGYPGQTPSGGQGGPNQGSPGSNGLPGPMNTRYRGTGGGGGGSNGYAGGPGGVGGPGAGGGGGAAGDGPGGVGGPGYVIVFIQ